LEYVMAFSGRGRTVLEEGSTRESVAAECREAALSFVNGVAAGWDKLDLVLWLTGPYARATRHVPRGERVAGLDEESDVADETIETLVTRTRSRIVASLETAALGDGTLEFAIEAMDRGMVRRQLDLDGDVVWVPADNTRMRLEDRVRSLFAADYLNDAAAYESLYVCHRCENVVLDENAKRLGACQNHKRVSGVVPRQVEPESDDHIVPAYAVGEDD
jgi:hypothetical protein